MSRRNTNENVSVFTLSRSEKEQTGSLAIKTEPTPTKTCFHVQLNDNARSENNTDIDLRIFKDICLNKYLNRV